MRRQVGEMINPWTWWRYRRPHPLAAARTFIERGRHGYAESDTWDLDGYLADIIAGGVGRIRDRQLGKPMGITSEQWDEILTTIADGFGVYADSRMRGIGSLDPPLDEAMALLAKWYPALWD